MKRLISILAILCLLVFLCIPVAAEDNELTNDGGTFTSDVQYYNPSNFTVVIPRTIDATQSLQLGALQMNIADNQVLYVSTESSSITLDNAQGLNATANMIFDGASEENHVAEFYMDDLMSRRTVSPVITNANEIPEGHYYGTCKFIVSLEFKQ